MNHDAKLPLKGCNSPLYLKKLKEDVDEKWVEFFLVLSRFWVNRCPPVPMFGREPVYYRGAPALQFTDRFEKSKFGRNQVSL